MINILIIEDDLPISAMLKSFLISKQYSVHEAYDGKQALATLEKSKIDLILLDWMLPDIGGPDLIKVIRKNRLYKEIPIIMLTARAEESDKIKGLEYGADDYMTKPVSLKELLARIKALLRRAQGTDQDNIIQKGGISLNIDNNELTIKGKNVKIGKTELRLLHYLMRTSGRSHSRANLLDQVWGQSVFIEERTVDVHILRLRKILKAYGVDHMVQTVRSVGYRFAEK